MQRYLKVESIENFNIETLKASTPAKHNILFLEFYSRRISLLIISQHEIQSFLLSFECSATFNAPEITVWFFVSDFDNEVLNVRWT